MSVIEHDQAGKLAAMAKQIADFFRPYPEEQATRSIAEHINKFWTRRMREEFLAIPDLHGGAVDPLVAKAAALIRPPRKEPGQGKTA